MICFRSCGILFIAESEGEGVEPTGKTGTPAASVPETTLERRGHGETSKTTEGAEAALDKDKEVSKETGEEAKDIKEVAPDKGKTFEATASEVENQTTESGLPGQADVKSEEQSSESKDSSSEDKADGVAKEEGKGMRSPEDVEKLFSPTALERLLGLLGAILPQDSKVGKKVTWWEEQTTLGFLVLLYLGTYTRHRLEKVVCVQFYHFFLL